MISELRGLSMKYWELERLARYNNKMVFVWGAGLIGKTWAFDLLAGYRFQNRVVLL